MIMYLWVWRILKNVSYESALMSLIVHIDCLVNLVEDVIAQVGCRRVSAE